MQHTVIPSWYQREGYIKAMANLIEKELQKFENPEKVLIFGYYFVTKRVLHLHLFPHHRIIIFVYYFSEYAHSIIKDLLLGSKLTA